MCNKVGLVSVHCDSQSAIHLARNQNTFNRRSKHIDIKYNFIRDEVEHKRWGLLKMIPKTIDRHDDKVISHQQVHIVFGLGLFSSLLDVMPIRVCLVCKLFFNIIYAC